MAFGTLMLGMMMGLLAVATVIPSDAGMMTIALSYVLVGTLTFMSVVLFAMLNDTHDDASELE